MNAEKGWVCQSCYRFIKEKIAYVCAYRNQCVFYKIRRLNYSVCLECFTAAIGNDKENIAKDPVYKEKLKEPESVGNELFVAEKLRAIIDTIS